MPFVEATMIAGYAPEVKQRLVTAFTRSVLSVMAAKPEAVIVVLREVEPANWARGGVSRIPGPPLPYAVDVVQAFVAGVMAGDGAAIAALTDAAVSVPGRVPADYVSFDESYAEHGSLVFAEGTIMGKPVIDRYHVIAGRIVGHKRWTDAGAQD